MAQAERNATATAVAAATSTVQNAAIATANAATTATAVTRLTAIARNEDLLRDDFSSNRNNWTEAEFSDEYSDGARQIVGGKYRWWVRSKGDTNHWESVPGFFEKDLFVSIKTKIVDLSASSGTAGVDLYLRVNEESSRYSISFFNDGTCQLWVFRNNKWTRLFTFPVTNAFQLALGVENVFAVYMQGSSFTVYANGQNLGTADDVTLDQAGQVGLGLFLQKANESITVEFDDLVIKRVGP
jgi:hypothetical protein